MPKQVMETSQAVAEAVKLCKPDVIAAYPITPQTHIVEKIAEFINNGELDSEMINVESEHSAMAACIGAQATGVRTFTASASQGLALMHEMLFIASGMRLPIVMAVANRALSAPINIWNDHSDAFAERDSGWIQLYVESSQEALDTIIQAYKIAENKDILLPVMVCIDGFTLSHVWEPVEIPLKTKVNKFLPKYRPIYAFLDPRKPITQGPIAFPNTYMGFKKMQQDAMKKAIKVIQDVNLEYKKRFKRGYGNGLIDTYKINDAEYVLVAMGSICGTARYVIDKLRKEGKKVGLLRIRSFRPFPADHIKNTLKNVKAVAVIDRMVSLGNEGALYTEIKSILPDKPVSGFITGLGGRDVRIEHIQKAFTDIMNNTEVKEEWLF